jgi:two-component system nitrogen regulation response regulator GlnG
VDLLNHAHPIQIVIIDDDQLVRNFVVHTIEYGINRKVTTFDNGFEAWQTLQNQPNNADIIIADANIPDMDGLELLHQVKQKFPHKKFILTTSNPEIENTAFQMGADVFLLKPYDVQDLFAIVQQFFEEPDTALNGKDSHIPKIPHSAS